MPGALAFVPFGETAGSEKLLSGLAAVAKKKGPVAAVQWLVKSSGALSALIKTPAGRAGLATVTLGFTAGWVAGSNAPKVQALATALKAVADQRLPADQTAQQVGQVLQAALGADKGAKQTQRSGTDTNWPAAQQPDSLAQAQTKLAQAKRRLAQSQSVWDQNPSNPGQREIVQAQQASVAQIQRKVDALKRSETAPGVSPTATARRPVPKVAPLPVVSQQYQPVGQVAKLPALARSQKSGSPTIEKPPSPTFPKTIDHSAAGSKKAMDRMGDVMREQRVNDYRNGRTTREAATQGLSGEALTRTQAALDDIDRSKMPPGGATGGRASAAANESATDAAKPTGATRRTKAERVRDISKKILKERFDGQNVSARFITRVKGTNRTVEVATPARDSDRLADGCPTTVGDVKKLLGGLNNSVVSITKGQSGLVSVKVESKGFRVVTLQILTSPKGIQEISIVEISASGPRTPQRNAATYEAMPDLDTTRQPLVGALLALKIVKFAEMNNVPKVTAFADFSAANPGSNDVSYQGARFWLVGGFDGQLTRHAVVARVNAFLQANPDVAKKVGLSQVTTATKVLDFLADSDGNLVPEAMEFWRSAPSSYQGAVNLSDKSSKSYKLYQRALSDFGLK
jgi:hypothetical protein